MKRSVSLWNPWILIPAGVIVAVISLIIYIQAASRKKRYTGETIAEILSVTRSSHYTNGRTTHIYTPKIAYIVNGNRYEVNGQGNGRKDCYQEGAQLPIHYNPR